MKKITLVFVAFLFSFGVGFSQTTALIEAPPHDLGTSANRAPNGTAAHAYMRGCELVLQSELTNIPINTLVSSFGFTLNSGTAGIPVTGNFTLYIENTTDVVYSKVANFGTAVSTMSTAYASTMAIPMSPTTTSIIITLTNPFLYTGGGLYVAYDWYSPGPYSTTAAVYRCNYLGLNPGAGTANGAALPTTLTNTNFRPCFLFGIPNLLTNDIQYIGIESAQGRVPAMFNTPYTVRAVVRNSSNVTQNNIPVTLNVAGANIFVDTQTITSLGAGVTTTVSFAAYSPTVPGSNTLTISVPSDQNNLNNSGTFNQTVTCNEWGLNPAPGNYTATSVGFGTGSGILACSYSNALTSTITSLRSGVSTNAASVGNGAWGVLMDAGGTILATTNTMIISNGMLGTFQTFSFSTPQNLSANTTYYFGFAQPANTTAYYPIGAATVPYISTSMYYNMPLAGGAPVVLAQNLGYFGIEAIFTPTINLTTTTPTVSCGSSATLTANGATTYSWSTTSTQQSIIVNPLVSTNYVVTGSDILGCSVTKTGVVAVTPLPIFIASSSNTICNGDVVTFTATGATNYTWSSGTTVLGTQQNLSDFPTNTTAYAVLGQDPNGCTSTTTSVVFVNQLPPTSIFSSTNTICLGESVTLTANGADTYLWDNGLVLQSITESPTVTTGYTVVGSYTNGCSSTETVNVVVNSFTPTITSPAAICKGDQLNVISSGGAIGSYTWSFGSTNFPQITVTPIITTIYTVSAISASNSCLGTNQTTITVNALPSLTVTATQTVMCRNQSNTITVSGASTYSWTGGITTSSIVITPTAATVLNYSIVGTSTDNCVSSKDFIVRVDACAGIGESPIFNSSISIYPNPSKGIINLHSEYLVGDTRVDIYNALGTLILTEMINENNTTLNLSTQASGIYFVKVMQNNKQIHISKIVKE